MRWIAFFLTVVALWLGASEADAQSLWKRRGFEASSMFSDTVALRRGDILTIIVREQQRMLNNDNTRLEKSSDLDAALEEFNIKPNAFNPLPTVSLTSSRDFEGIALVNKNGLFETRLSVLVVDVQPNGNLIVEGKRNITVDRDVRTLRVTGLVRPQDVTGQNTVLSQNVANASIMFQGRGPAHQATNRSWFDYLLDFLWPF